MSLICWLPLNGDLKNYGFGDIYANGGATVDEEGKIGKCYNFNTKYIYTNDFTIPTTNWSIAAWIYPTTDSSSSHQWIVGMNTSTASDFLGIIAYYKNKFSVRIAGTTYQNSTTSALNNWYHVAVTYSNNTAKLYVNGVLSSTFTTVDPVAATKLFIGCRGVGAGYFYGKVNDVRVYDHTLSDTEVKEISMGLICHYKLDDPEVEKTTNLVTTYCPDASTETWGGHTTVWTAEYVKDLADYDMLYIPTLRYLKGAVTYSGSGGGGASRQIQLIAVSPSTVYTYSAYIKTSDDFESSNANLLYRYDFPGTPSNPGTRIVEGGGFSRANRIYCGNGWYRCWWTFTTNAECNTVRIATFLYPNENYTYMMAGWQLEKGDHMTPYIFGTTRTPIVVDSSGYGHHGECYYYDDTGTIQSSTDSARNSVSTFVNAGDVATSSNTGAVFLYGKCKLTTPKYLSVAFWCKPINGYNNKTANGQFCTTANTTVAISTPSDYNTTAMHHRDSMIDMSSSTSVHKTVSIEFTANEWHHYAVVYDGRYGRVYKDGTQTATLDMGSELSLATFEAFVIGYSYAGNVKRKNQAYYSDFRVYCTALSAIDVLNLYKVTERIDNSGNLYGYEYEEKLLEYYEFLFDPSDNSNWIHIAHHNIPSSGLFSSTDTFASDVYIDKDRWFFGSICNYIFGPWELMVKQKFTSDGTESSYRWIQTVNPMDGSDNAFEQTKEANITKVSGSVSGYGGIWRINNNTYLCANNGTKSNYFCAIGSWTQWKGGIPGYATGNTAITTGYLDLYLRIDNVPELSPAVFKQNGVVIAGGSVNHNLINTNAYYEENTYTYPDSSYSDKILVQSSVVPNKNYKYVLSFYAKSSVSGNKMRVYFHNPNNNTVYMSVNSQGMTSYSTDGNSYFVLSTEWTLYWVVYTLSSSTATTDTKQIICPRLFASEGSSGGTVSIRMIKLEEGKDLTGPTPWSYFETNTWSIPTSSFNSSFCEFDYSGTKISERKFIQSTEFKEM